MASSPRRTGSGSSGELRTQRLPRALELAPPVVQLGRGFHHPLAELFPFGIVGKRAQPRRGRAQRERVAGEVDLESELGILQRVLLRSEAGDDEPGLARMPETVQPLALVGVRLRLPGLAQRLELLGREEVGVARDDLRLLGYGLQPDAHRVRLLGSLEEIVAES